MLLTAATIMTIAGSIFGPLYLIGLNDHGKDARLDSESSYLSLAIWLGGTLGGITLFWLAAW